MPYFVGFLIVALLEGTPGLLTREAAAQSITQEQAAAILEELKQIRLLLERGQRQESARGAAPVVPDQRAIYMPHWIQPLVGRSHSSTRTRSGGRTPR
jgi:hypothetical protein